MKYHEVSLIKINYWTITVNCDIYRLETRKTRLFLFNNMRDLLSYFRVDFTLYFLSFFKKNKYKNTKQFKTTKNCNGQRRARQLIILYFIICFCYSRVGNYKDEKIIIVFIMRIALVGMILNPPKIKYRSNLKPSFRDIMASVQY